jgi:hypothetical protein
MYSTSNIKEFYQPEDLRETLISLAALNIILCEEDWLRYHRYTRNWTENVEMAEIDNGAGDHLYILFTPQATVLKGFDHESPLSPYVREGHKLREGIYDNIPSNLLELLKDVSIQMDDATFCIWHEASDRNWKTGNISFDKDEDDGSGFLFGTILDSAEKFKDWADDYFEMDVPLTIVDKIYKGKVISDEMILILNKDCNLGKVKEELSALY